MSVMDDKELHSRSSVDTAHVDLEKGEARHEKEEEEIIEEKVHLRSFHMSYILAYIPLGTTTGRERLWRRPREASLKKEYEKGSTPT